MRSFARASLAALTLVACTSTPPGLDAGESDARDTGPIAPDAATIPPQLARYCTTSDWGATLQPATLGTPAGRMRVGFIDGPAMGVDFEAGTMEAVRFWPAHPFVLRTVRLALEGSGRVRVRVVRAYGRSHPACHLWEGDPNDVDLVPPVDVDLTNADPSVMTEVDVSASGAVLEPTIPYFVVLEHLGGADPHLAIVATPMGVEAESFLLFPETSMYIPGGGATWRDSFGVGGDYDVEVVGDYACPIPDAQRGMSVHAPLAGAMGGRVHVVDFDGDGHDDVVVSAGPRPQLFLGDGHGGLTLAATDPFPASEGSGLPYFADLNGDGAMDAFVTEYTSLDGDGDHHRIDVDDCDDTSATIPGPEIAGNGIDENCDGVADDGTSSRDADADGVTIAGGDCDDTRSDTHVGAVELHDSRDNDCDGHADEDFVHHVLLNDGAGHLVRVPDATSGVAIHGATAAGALADYDGDGHLDVFVGNWLLHYPDAEAQPSLLFRGHGDGTFEDATSAAGMAVATPRPVYGVTWNDWDGDGDQDLLVSTYQLQDDFLWRDDGAGDFVDVAHTTHVDHDAIFELGNPYPGGHSYGGEFGDLDGDGDLDAFLANLAHPRFRPWSDRSRVLYNMGAPTFAYEERTELSGYPYNEGDANPHMGDYDLDGDLDLVVTSHYGLHQRVFRNDPDSRLVEVTYELGVRGRAESAIWVDLDEDGDLDLVTADAGAPLVFLNQLAHGTRHWVELLLEDTGGNHEAIGARVTLMSAGHTLVREVRTTGALANRQASHWVHVGLGDTTAVDSVSVRWPDGTVESFHGVGADARYHLRRGTGAATR